ncbi:hypothetical protein CHLNCDRAFT_36088 [Chlorella variabilis]|uniref:polyribonucleotide nucleotidyltransferase n=1 Tax=Chlorella variabilis TaxID=554065 RepID=E1ZIU8_CHLVA|nr:hypothetical protein CHLNCDRAFT_36088 [Chlorella variabilis]EFN54220.1 hypothetical protein CHLNCDRAFT_36088 [Chlorella variabilis]|eukprot:XP_005846322.1 hypothetical protein CHLNCDRAFT_36088 [Chlorella variabilis]
MSRAAGGRRFAALLARGWPAHVEREAAAGWLSAGERGRAFHPAAVLLHPFSSTAGGVPADQLPLPEAKLKDDVEDAIRGEAEELPAIGQEEAALATAAAAIPGQQPMATDAIAALPMGQALRQEALVQGHTWAFETGKLARLANGSCLVQCGNTTVLAAATCQLPPWSRREAQSLQFEVDYREKLYAVGRIPGTYNKREGTAKEHEVLAGRRIGRALRPLFPKGFALDAAVFASVLSADGGCDPEVMAVSSASAALLCSDMPWAGPVAAARVAMLHDGQLVVGPSVEQQEAAVLDLLVAATADGRVTMLEADGEQVPETQFLNALHLAVSTTQQLIKPQMQLAEQTRRQTRPTQLSGADPAAAPKVAELATPLVEAILRDDKLTKSTRTIALQQAKDSVLARLKANGSFRTEFARVPGSGCVSPADLEHAFTAVLSSALRRLAVEEGWRCDGRGAIDVRPVHCEVDSVPVVHGSALFSRGETQSLCTVTVGRRQEQQKMESLLGGEGVKRLFVNYSFPPFAVGETSTSGMRREMGHSDLAERALLPVIPDMQAFPFSLRLNAETLASAGSSSMAAVCGGALALADAGVPLKALVAGVTVGLLTESSWGGELRLLSSVALGMEDQLGDMDLKVAGTSQGITACQLDVKLQGGVPLEILNEAIGLAARGRAKLLGIMEKALPEKRGASAPMFGSVKVPEAMMGRVIGSGGANLKDMEERLDVRVDVGDDGVINVFAPSQNGYQAAEARILDLTGESVKEGAVYRGTVTRLMDFGAMVELEPSGLRALLHISEVSAQRVRSIDDVLQIGQQVEVMCVGRDPKGQVKLSRKAVLAHNAQQQAAKSVAGGGGFDNDK